VTLRSVIDNDEEDDVESTDDGPRYDIKHERKGDKVVVRWGITIPDPEKPGERKYGGDGLVSLPVAVFNHIASSDVIED
jgi:hypothetical protein